MKGLGLVLAAALTASAAPSWAAPMEPGRADPHVRVVDYDQWQVIKLSGALRTASEIILGPEETITHVALGDSSIWEVAVEANTLFLKPRLSGAPTNLLVSTSGPDGLRNYTFALSVLAPGAAGGAVYVLRLRYPDAERTRAQTALQEQQAGIERALLQLKLERAVLEGPRNLAYAVQGPVELQPSEVTDNGRFTLLRFPANQPLPAIYLVQPDGGETLASFDVRGDFVVVHAVAQQLRLRRGRQVLCIYNQAFDPMGRGPSDGTSAPDVERTLKAPGS